MTEYELKEYKDYIRARLKRAFTILNNIEPDEDNLWNYTQLSNIAKDIKSTIVLMKRAEKKRNT